MVKLFGDFRMRSTPSGSQRFRRTIHFALSFLLRAIPAMGGQYTHVAGDNSKCVLLTTEVIHKQASAGAEAAATNRLAPAS